MPGKHGCIVASARNRSDRRHAGRTKQRAQTKATKELLGLVMGVSQLFMPELLHVAPRVENMPSNFTIVRQNHCAALT